MTTIRTTLEEQRDAIGQELADVAIYLIQLADVIGISLRQRDRLQDRGQRWALSGRDGGSAAKHTEIRVHKAGEPD